MAKQRIDGYIVEHSDGVMGLSRGFRDRREEVLYLSCRVTAIFRTRSAARWAIDKTIREREAWLRSLPNALPGAVERDAFTKKYKYSIRKAAFKN
jgi:hypothetical protein